MMIKKHHYSIAFISLLLVEIAIALWVRDPIIRPYGGDTLAVMGVYTLLGSILPSQTFQKQKMWFAIIAVFFAILVETLQAVNFVNLIGLEDNTIARIILGSSFSWLDILAYFIGFLLIITVERAVKERSTKNYD